MLYEEIHTIHSETWKGLDIDVRLVRVAAVPSFITSTGVKVVNPTTDSGEPYRLRKDVFVCGLVRFSMNWKLDTPGSREYYPLQLKRLLQENAASDPFSYKAQWLQKMNAWGSDRATPFDALCRQKSNTQITNYELLSNR